jgi:tetratricopeptide (TPR) repeat protein
VERLARWARRSPAAAALLAVTLLVATTALGAGGWLISRQILTARAVEADLREADRLQQQSAFTEAGAALERARSRLGDGGPFWMYPVVEAARRDHQFLVRLEAIRLNRFTLAEGGLTHAAQMRFNKARADRDYAEAFRGQGLGEPANDPEGAAARVRAFKWAAHLVAALDDWAVCAADRARQDWVVGVARRADPDPWRDRVREPAGWRDGKALAELARAAPAEEPVSLLLALGERLTACGEDGVGFLRRVREQHPEDFWANFTLALALHGPERYPGGNSAPALVYYEKALEIRPQAVAVRNDLGVVLLDMGWMWDNARDGGGPGAYTVFYRAVKSDARFAPGFNNLGLALKGKGDWGLSVLLFRDALQSDPQLPPAHFNLGEIRAGSGSLDEAIDHYRQALAVDPDFGLAHCYLGVALIAKGRRDEVDDCYPESVKALERFRGRALGEASAYYGQAFRGDPEWAPARNPLRIPPQDEARLKEAIDHFRQAVRLAPEFPQTHRALGQALLALREFTDAEAEIRRGLDLLAEWQKDLRPNLERLLQRCQRLRALEGRLPAVVRGKDRPAAADCLDLAELCFVKNHFATAARLYAEALAATPQLTEDLLAGRRFNAARAAALAGGGHGRRRGRAWGAKVGGVAQTGAVLVATRPGRVGPEGGHRHGGGPHPGSEDVGALAGRPRPDRATRRGRPEAIASGRTAGMSGAVARGGRPAPACRNDQVSRRPGCGTRSRNFSQIADRSVAAVNLSRIFSRTCSRRGCHAQLARCRGGSFILTPPVGGVRLRPLVSRGALRQGLLEAVHVLKTVLGALGQTAENHAFEIGWHISLMLRRWHHLVSDVSDHDFHRIRAIKGRATGEKGVGKRAHGVDVAASVA